MKTNIIVLAAGHVDFDAQESGYPLCVTELDGVSLLERIVNNTMNIEGAKYLFAFLRKDAERFHLDKVTSLLVPDSLVVRVSEGCQGSACTALLAACQLNQDDELLIVSANELVDIDMAEVVFDFRRRKLRGGTLIFRSIHPRYSYVRLDDEGYVLEAAQQEPISQHATAGVFWFARVGEFVESTKNLIRKNASVAGKFFVAPVFNELILNQAKVGVYELDVNRYRPLKTRKQVEQFEKG
jgi:hypothetical protein